MGEDINFPSNENVVQETYVFKVDEDKWDNFFHLKAKEFFNGGRYISTFNTFVSNGQITVSFIVMVGKEKV